MLSIPGKKNKKVPARFTLGTLKTLYSQFVTENIGKCSFSALNKHVPFDVMKHKTNDWETCLCAYCLNPELKVEALNDLKILPPISVEENITNEEGLQIITSQLDSLSTTESSKSTEGSQIVFQEWCKIESQSQGLKISSKVTCSEKIPEFLKLLKNDIFFQ